MVPKSKNCTPFPYTPLHSPPPLNVSMSSYLKGIHNFCNFGGSLMKDPGKWNGSIDYINKTIMEGIVPRYQEKGKWMRQPYGEDTEDPVKGYFWCPEIHERKIILIFGFYYCISNTQICDSHCKQIF